MPHFSVEFVRAAAVTLHRDAPSSDSNDGIAAGQPLLMLLRWTSMPDAPRPSQGTDVTAALARSVDPTDGYRVHPATLDGSFQLGAAVPSASVQQMV